MARKKAVAWARLLQSLRDGKRYSKSNDLWAPLSQSGLVHITSSGPPKYRVVSVELTEPGLAHLEFLEEEYATDLA